MPSVHHFVDISSSNVNYSSVNIIDENYEAVSNEHNDVADNPVTINGERYISLSELYNAIRSKMEKAVLYNKRNWINGNNLRVGKKV